MILTGFLQLFDGLAVRVGGFSILTLLETFISSLFQLSPGLRLRLRFLFLRHISFSVDDLKERNTELAAVH